MTALDQTSREYWQKVLVTGGFAAIPRWTREPMAGIAEHEVRISDELGAALRRLADGLSVPISSVLLTAHTKVLGALSGERAVGTGYVVEGKRALPCRMTIETQSWRALLLEAHRVESELLSNRDFPVDDLRRELGLTGPLFETVLDLATNPSIGELPEGIALWVGIAQQDGLVLRLRYRTDRIDADCAARIAGYHLTALALIAADPDAEHARQSLLSAEEMHLQIHSLIRPPKTLPDRRVHELIEERVRAQPDAIAVVCGKRQWTYREVNARANQLGRALLARGLKREEVVAVVTERNPDWMAAVLAVLKAGGVYLPIEPHFPPDRIAKTLSRAQCKFVVTETGSTHTLDAALGTLPPGIQKLFVDAVYQEGHDNSDLGIVIGANEPAYIFFTSGSTGEPKGAMCEHAGMLNHLFAKIEDLGIEEGAVFPQIGPQCFDISLWQLVAGVVVGGRTLIIEQEVILDIQRFVDTIIDGKVSVMQVVPAYLDAVLSYLEEWPLEFPDLKCVSTTGDLLPMSLVQRWFAAMPSVKLVNTFGLTETSDDTVHEVMDRPPEGDKVPLGPPIPNVYVYVVDENLSPVPLGAPGEIVFSGVCVGRGYVNDPERTRLAFMDDPLRPGERLYRTGDFGRWRPDGKLDFLGRRDAQVKISGFRIEIGDIETALARAPGVLQGAVVIAERADKSKRLVAFYTSEQPLDVDALRDHLTRALPPYMVPSTIHWQERLPLSANLKIDRKTLTALAGEVGTAEKQTRYSAPTTPTEELFCEVLAATLGLEQASVDGNLFYDFGIDSMRVAEFLALLRKRAGDRLASVSRKDVYDHPTIKSLAALTDARPVPPPRVAPASAKVVPVSTVQYYLCGALQLLSALAYSYLIAIVSIEGYEWVSAGSDFLEVYGRAVLVSGAGFLGMCLLPMLAKWTLIGRWKPQQIRVWTLEYFRFWLVKTLVRLNPVVLFVGSPIYVLYLRALGAKIGRNVVILSPHVPVCTDLLTIGDNAVICKDSFFSCYNARDGVIHTGTVTIGKDTFVGELTVLEIGSSLGDGAQLGHSSSLRVGQDVPQGEHRGGSPARQRTAMDYRNVDPVGCGTLRKIAYSAFVLLSALVISAFFLSIAARSIPVIAERPHFAAPGFGEFSDWAFYRDALVTSLLLFVGSILFGLVFVVTVPRLLNLAIKPDTVYPLYGFHYWIHKAIGSTSNNTFFTKLFGDSSYIVYYLQAIGYDLSKDPVQTGSNFGSEVRHDNPFLVSIGRGTMIADGLFMINTEYSSTSFRVSRVTIGPDNFFGNDIVYPSQGRTGDNCLLATKVMVPVAGKVRENVGLLGSPSFKIPRVVNRDPKFSPPEDQARALADKNKHNLVTIGLYLLTLWFSSFLVVLLFFGAGVLYEAIGVSAFALALVLAPFVTTAFGVLVERASTSFQKLQPRECSILHPHFWHYERFWKLRGNPLPIFDGTPFRSVTWWLLGMNIGKRVFDDGCLAADRTMVTIGDDCTLNAGSGIGTHSQEDGGFKSGPIKLGAGCTLGVKALVHYGVEMGDGASVAAASFVMKGEFVPPHTRWEGNPANQVQNDDLV